MVNLKNIGCAFLVILLSRSAWAEFRIWTGQNGSVVEAEFVSEANGTVALRLRDGKVIRVPQAKLSAEDVEFLGHMDENAEQKGSLQVHPIIHLTFDNAEHLGANKVSRQKFRPVQLEAVPAGRKGGAALFNGKNSSVQLGRPLPLQNQPCTMAFWFKTDCDDYQELFSYGANIKGCCVYTDGNKVGSMYRWGRKDKFKEFSSSKIKADSGAWNHVCLTIDQEGNGTLYGNGIKLISRQVVLLLDNPAAGAVIGQGNVAAQEGIAPYSGLLDDFFWFDVALNPEQVEQLYND